MSKQECGDKPLMTRQEAIQWFKTELLANKMSDLQGPQNDAATLALDALQKVDELAAADKAGRVVVLPDMSCTNADGEEALRRALWDCNYKNNGVTRFAADAIAEKLCNEAQKVRIFVKTPLGDIVAEPSTDSDNPGIWISLHQLGEDYKPTLALVEYTKDEVDTDSPTIITRVWQNAHDDEYTTRIIHAGFEKRGAE